MNSHPGSPVPQGLLRFEHIGMAVRDFQPAVAHYTLLGYTCDEPIHETFQNVEVVFCRSPRQPTVELIRPVDETSPVANLLKKRQEMLYHLCYVTDDLEAALAALEEKNRVICISPAKPTVLFPELQAAFYHVHGVGLMEILFPPPAA